LTKCFNDGHIWENQEVRSLPAEGRKGLIHLLQGRYNWEATLGASSFVILGRCTLKTDFMSLISDLREKKLNEAGEIVMRSFIICTLYQILE
jgi:hypothetical protein